MGGGQRQGRELVVTGSFGKTNAARPAARPAVLTEVLRCGPALTGPTNTNRGGPGTGAGHTAQTRSDGSETAVGHEQTVLGLSGHRQTG